MERLYDLAGKSRDSIPSDVVKTVSSYPETVSFQRPTT
jgi:hypothetical protein